MGLRPFSRYFGVAGIAAIKDREAAEKAAYENALFSAIRYDTERMVPKLVSSYIAPAPYVTPANPKSTSVLGAVIKKIERLSTGSFDSPTFDPLSGILRGGN